MERLNSSGQDSKIGMDPKRSYRFKKTIKIKIGKTGRKSVHIRILKFGGFPVPTKLAKTGGEGSGFQ
jgi:hypothetical protein